MTTFVALLHSIVLGPGRRVVMSDLRAMAEDEGFALPRTLVATGNLLFEAEGHGASDIEARLEAACERRFGRHVDIIVRRGEDWQRLVAGNPFPEQSRADPRYVIVRVMRQPVTPSTVASLAGYVDNGEELAVVDGDLWIYFARDIGHSKLAAAMTPKRLGGAGTSRNWNTVRRLGAMLNG